MGICSVSFHLFLHIYIPPLLLPTSDQRCTKSRAAVAPQLLSQVKAPAGSLQLHSGRQKRGEMLQLSLLRSHSSLMALKCIIMQMWILILNFKKRLFLFQTNNKKVPFVVSIASLSCKWIVNYAFSKRGLGEKETALLKPFLCPLNSHVCVGTKSWCHWRSLGNLSFQKLVSFIAR